MFPAGGGGELPLQGAGALRRCPDARNPGAESAHVHDPFRLSIVARDAGEGHVLLAEGDTVHVVVDRAMLKTVLPERFAAALRTLGGGAQ